LFSDADNLSSAVMMRTVIMLSLWWLEGVNSGGG
jgi:hypothetical protein